MKVVFDHITGFGKVAKQDFIYSNPRGIDTTAKFLTHLDNGWIEWGDYWYNMRSVRIRIDDYKPTKTTEKMAKKIDTSLKIFHESDLEALREVYKKYVTKRGFERDIALEDFLGMFTIEYKYNDEVIAAVYFRIYEEHNRAAMVSYQFIWDYQDPKLSMGNVSQFYEHKYAKMMGLDYIYLLGGYEEVSKYKSIINGFEWWTGEEWSKDKDKYIELCERDSTIRIDGNI